MVPLTAEAARPFLSRAQAFDVSGGVVSQSENESGCEFVGMSEGGQIVAAMSMRRVNGTLWIVQAGGAMREASLCEIVGPALDNAARSVGVESLAFVTKRRGLIRQMEKQGYREAGVIMRKVLQ